MCKECYVDDNRITPPLNPLDCFKNQPLRIDNAYF